MDGEKYGLDLFGLWPFTAERVVLANGENIAVNLNKILYYKESKLKIFMFRQEFEYDPFINKLNGCS